MVGAGGEHGEVPGERHGGVVEGLACFLGAVPGVGVRGGHEQGGGAFGDLFQVHGWSSRLGV